MLAADSQVQKCKITVLTVIMGHEAVIITLVLILILKQAYT